ncbi:MAG: MerR family transcriptional regulator [Treponema sp.]|nr:MerR family transcriptional regulator [Treponema sp.]
MMYTRGQFAIIGKVGRKALRLYHEEGLLVPASVNAENGYHYYDESQLKVLEKIKRLRKFGLSLYDIKQVLDGKVLENELVNSKIKEMDVMLQEIKELASSNENAETKTKDGEPDIRSFETCRCLFIEENVELENLGMSVGKLYEKAAREKIKVEGNHFVLYEGLSSENNFSMRTCLPVKDFAGENTLEVTEEKCLHINFTGGFSKVGNAHILIKEYADAHKIKLADKAYEVYNKDMSVDVYYAIV